MFSLALLNFFGNIRQLLPFKIQIKFDALASLTSCPFFIKDNRLTGGWKTGFFWSLMLQHISAWVVLVGQAGGYVIEYTCKSM